MWESEPCVHCFSVICVLERPKDSADKNKTWGQLQILTVGFFLLYYKHTRRPSELLMVTSMHNVKPGLLRLLSFTPPFLFNVLMLGASPLERLLPFHDIQHADWQVAQCENKKHHHQHASRLASGSDLFDLSTDRARPDSDGFSPAWSWSWALYGPPLPLQHWGASRNL